MEIFWINYILICIICYLVGSIPTAYIVLKRKYNIDITKAGTGNVGAVNGYDVTGSKKTGITIFLFDFLKGSIPSVIILFFLRLPFQLAIFPVILILLGNNFSIWLRFKGGRGLSVASGISIALNFWMLIIWGVTFLVIYAIKKNVHLANVIATIFMPIIAILPGNFFIKYSSGISNSEQSSTTFFIFWTMVAFLILIRHIQPFTEYIQSIKKK